MYKKMAEAAISFQAGSALSVITIWEQKRYGVASEMKGNHVKQPSLRIVVEEALR